MQTAIQVLTAFLGSLGFGLIFHLRNRHLVAAALGGMFIWIIYLIAVSAIDGIFFPTLIASAFSALYAEIMARVQKAPATLYLITAVVPLIPGGSLYHTMSCAVRGEWGQFSTYGMDTIQYALGIAIGMSLVWAVYDMADRILHRNHSEQK